MMGVESCCTTCSESVHRRERKQGLKNNRGCARVPRPPVSKKVPVVVTGLAFKPIKMLVS